MLKSSSFINDVMLELHVSDFQKAYDFYRLLDFEMVWMEEDYLVMKRGASVLAFYGNSPAVAEHSYFGRFEHDSKKGYAVEIVLFVDDLQTFYQRIKSKVRVVAELTNQPWGCMDFRIEDPFGFYLRITEPYDPVNCTERIRSTKSVVRRLGFKV